MIVPYDNASLPTTGWYGYLGRCRISSSPQEENRTYEVIQGLRVEKRSGLRERMLAHDIFSPLFSHLHDKNLGWLFHRMPFHLPHSGNERMPDVSFSSYEKWGRNKRFPSSDSMPFAPNLAVEVIGPWELTWATFAKLEDYFGNGVEQVWHILPHIKRVHCYTSPTAVRIFSPGDELIAEALFPSFHVPISDLFWRPD